MILWWRHPSHGLSFSPEMIGIRGIFGLFAGTKGLLLVLAGALALGGMAWNGGGWSSEAPPPVAADPLQDSIQDSLRADWSEGSPRPDTWLGDRAALGDGAIRVGLSFIAAMIFGSLLRVAVKTSLSLLFLGGIVVWILQSRGMIELGWEDYYGSVRESRHWLMDQIGMAGRVLQAHLPSASAALIGFGFGLRR